MQNRVVALMEGHISPINHDPQNDDGYNKLASMLDELLDIVGGNESHVYKDEQIQDSP